MSELNDKQARFVAEYLIDLNATKAATRAGYSPKTAHVQGHELLKHPKVQQAIEAAQNARAERTGITQDYVLDGIRELVERCSQAVPVRDKKGNATGEFKFEPAAALRGLELLGKHLGLFPNKVEHTGSVTMTHEDRVSRRSEILERRRAERLAALQPAPAETSEHGPH